MKKNLKVTGKVQFFRHDFIKILTEVLSAEDLQLERAIAVDGNANPLPLHSIICYVHQSKNQDQIPDAFDGPQKVNMPKGIRRPNRGLGKALKELFLDLDRVVHIDWIFRELKNQFPHLTKSDLQIYLKRPEMTGCKLEIHGNEYWNPNSKKS